MKEVYKIINQIKKENKTNEKIKILKNNKDNKLLQKVLFYTYNPYYKYKINKIEKISEIQSSNDIFFNDIFELLDTLKENNINNNLRVATHNFLNKQDLDIKELYSLMILKDLKINCNYKTINKVWNNLIPSFEVQLAENYFKNNDYIKDKEITITPKLDGHRVIVIVDNKGKTTFYSRQGKVFEGLIDIEEQFEYLPIDYVYDGEILTTFDINPNEQYQEVSKILRKKGEKQNLKIVLFDMLPLDEFKNQNCSLPYCERINRLQKNTSSIKNLYYKNGDALIEVIPNLYQGKTNEDIILSTLEKMTTQGYEGLMINVNNSSYEFKRTKNLLKVKKFQTADVLVKNIEEGTGKYQGKLGAIEIEFGYDNNTYTCFCGSGFNDHQRELFFKNPSLILNKVVEIQYFEITKNENGGYGFRFPVFKHIREDKAKDELSLY